MAPEPIPARTFLALAFAVLAMSTGAILIRLVQEAGPLAIAFHRLAFAALLIGAYALWRHGDELRALDRRRLAWLALTGVVLALHFATWVTSLGLTTVASSVVLVTMHPVVVAVLGLVWLGEGMRGRGWVGMFVALAGAVMLLWGDFALEGPALVGDALAFAGAVFAALYFLSGRRERKRLSLPAYASVVYSTAALTLAVFALGTGEPLAGFPAGDYALFVAMALGPQVLGHTIANWSLRWVPASVVSTAIVGEPLGASLLALVILSEVPPATSLLGGVVILTGIFLVARGQRAPKPRSAPTPG